MKATNLYEEAIQRYEEISKLCLNLEKRMDKYPPGKIHIIQSRKNAQYYLRTNAEDKSGEYIQKRQTEKIQKYLQKKYDEEIYKVLSEERKALGKMLIKTRDVKRKIQSAYSNNLEEVKALINPIDISDEEYIKEWLDNQYERKPIDEGKAIWKTNRGEYVRSKSELNIANMLEKNGVPYKYECPFTLSNGRIIHPDFTLLDVKNRKEIYWEHRGMMDDIAYTKHTTQRLKLMAKEGVLIGDNLIITEEFSGCPLGTDEIEQVIKLFAIS